jgi:ATP-dependent RNA helicase DDX49/DBP8
MNEAARTNSRRSARRKKCRHCCRSKPTGDPANCRTATCRCFRPSAGDGLSLVAAWILVHVCTDVRLPPNQPFARIVLFGISIAPGRVAIDCLRLGSIRPGRFSSNIMSTLFGKRKRKAPTRELGVPEEEKDGNRNGGATEAPHGEELRPHHEAEGLRVRLSTPLPPGEAKDDPVIDTVQEEKESNGSEEEEEGEMQTTMIFTFADLDLAKPLLDTCASLGLTKPTPVQAAVIPFLLRNTRDSVLAVAPTGTGKTVAYVLPMLHHLSFDPYGIFGLILTPTRELAKQIHEQVVALGSPTYRVNSCLAIGGLDATEQACQISRSPPHFLVATPGRLRILLQSADPPPLRRLCRYWVLDEADRLLVDDFEADLAAIALALGGGFDEVGNDEASTTCQRLFFSATMTNSLQQLEAIATNKTGARRKAKLVQFRLTEKPSSSAKVDYDMDGKPSATGSAVQIPTNLSQEYLFVPSKIREAYLLALLRSLLVNGGRKDEEEETGNHKNKGKRGHKRRKHDPKQAALAVSTAASEPGKSKSAIIFCSSCERAALISEMLRHVGVSNTPLHSILSQPRRLASLAKFRNGQVPVLVATDLGSRGLDIPATDLVLNLELPPSAITYIHRIGRTARAGRRGRAISLVAETDVALVHAAEAAAGRPLVLCATTVDVKPMLSVAAKALRWAKLRLQDIGFDDLLMKFKARKGVERKLRERRRKDRTMAEE